MYLQTSIEKNSAKLCFKISFDFIEKSLSKTLSSKVKVYGIDPETVLHTPEYIELT